MSGTIKINGEELTIQENNSSDIALSSFSGYIGFVGEMSARYGGAPGKTVGLVFSLSSGVVTGVFDKNMNPQKEYDNIIGTAAIGFGLGWAGAKAGAIIGASISGPFAPVGAVVGAVLGAVAGGLWGDDIYNNAEKLIKALADNIDEEFEYYDQTIYGKVTLEEYILHGDRNVMDAFPDYVNYRQIVEIRQGGGTLADYIRYNSSTREAQAQTNGGVEKEKEMVEVITQETQADKLTLNNHTYDITTADDLAVRNAIDSIPKVSFLLSNILIKSGEVLDVGSAGVYEIKSGDTLSEIAQSHSMSTQDLLKLNTWLVDEGRVEFEQDKVLIDPSANNLNNKDHTLEGTTAEDRLIDRNGGDDTLKGGKGNDYLEGGTGYDTYIIDGFGENTVFDSDDNGMINFNGNVLSHAIDNEGNGIYVDAYNNTYEFNGNDLMISSSYNATKAIIKDYDNGALGIYLDGKENEEKPGAVAGKEAIEITKATAHSTYAVHHPDQSTAPSDSAALDFYRALYPNKVINYVGSNSYNLGGGDDDVYAKSGSDTIRTNDGNDTITTTDGNDYIDSGNGWDSVNAAGDNNTIIQPRAAA